KVVATLARTRARDVHGEASFTVLSRAATVPDAPEVKTRDDVELSFRLDREDFGPGDTVQGTLVATPLQACQAGEVRVELVRHEGVPSDDGNTKDMKEGGAIMTSDESQSVGGP